MHFRDFIEFTFGINSESFLAGNRTAARVTRALRSNQSHIFVYIPFFVPFSNMRPIIYSKETQFVISVNYLYDPETSVADVPTKTRGFRGFFSPREQKVRDVLKNKLH